MHAQFPYNTYETIIIYHWQTWIVIFIQCLVIAYVRHIEIISFTTPRLYSWGQNCKFFTTPLSRNSQKRLGFRRAYGRGGLGRVLITGLRRCFNTGTYRSKFVSQNRQIQPQNQVAIMTLVDRVALSEDRSAISWCSCSTWDVFGFLLDINDYPCNLPKLNICRLSLIVRVNVVLNRAVVVDSPYFLNDSWVQTFHINICVNKYSTFRISFSWLASFLVRTRYVRGDGSFWILW